MKKKSEIKLTVIYTPGWEQRFAKACYELYKRIEAKKAKEVKV